jgi:hypothetical protein
MKYADAVSFRRALEDRLNAAASGGPTTASRLRKKVALERFLARFGEVAPGQWFIKGGVALEFRLQDLARATKDLDLWMREHEEAATNALIAATERDLADYFVFSIQRAHRIGDDDEGITIRYRLRADMAGREFETVAIDVALASAIEEEPDVLSGSNLLAFAEFEPVRVPALPLDFQVAEKLHAFTRTYAGEARSSRVKDLVDLVLISTFAEFEVGRLRNALDHTLDSRRSHPLPTAFPSPPANWAQTYARLASEVAIADDLLVVHRVVARFLDPVLSENMRSDMRWNPSTTEWN